MLPSLRQLLSILFLTALTALTAQDSYQQLIPAAGEVTLADGSTYYWSLGDVFADDLTGGSVLVISGVREDLARQHGIRLIGNPTPALTRLEVTTPLPLRYRLNDLTGRTLLSSEVREAHSYAIDLSGLVPQLYLLSVFSGANGRLLATYRVRKQ